MKQTRSVAWVKRTRSVAWVKQNDFNDLYDYAPVPPGLWIIEPLRGTKTQPGDGEMRGKSPLTGEESDTGHHVKSKRASAGKGGGRIGSCRQMHCTGSFNRLKINRNLRVPALRSRLLGNLAQSPTAYLRHGHIEKGASVMGAPVLELSQTNIHLFITFHFVPTVYTRK